MITSMLQVRCFIIYDYEEVLFVGFNPKLVNLLFTFFQYMTATEIISVLS